MPKKTIKKRKAPVATEAFDTKVAQSAKPVKSEQEQPSLIDDKNIPAEEIKQPEPISQIPKYTLKPTDDPHLFRVIDRKGDWVVYYHDQRKKYLWAVNYILRGGFPKGDGFMNYLLGTTKEEAKKTLEAAGERGSRVHDAIRDLINGEEIAIDKPYLNELTGRWEVLTDEEWNYLRSWVAWVAEYKPEVIAHETSVAADRYAGTIDFYGTIEVDHTEEKEVRIEKFAKDGKKETTIKIEKVKTKKRIRVLLDYKTSGGIWPEYKLQVAAYAYALRRPPEFTGVVRLGTKHKNGGFEMKLWDHTETKLHYQTFRATMRNFDFTHPAYEHNDETIPAKLSVKIPRKEK